jgi:ribosomal protein S18 acetylase RimI-like enzyme
VGFLHYRSTEREGAAEMRSLVELDIRPATRDDLPAIASIHLASWRDAYSEILPTDYLADQVQLDLQAHWDRQEVLPLDVVLLADTVEGPVGFVAVWCRSSPFIDNLHVLPSMRSGGIGVALMRAAARRLLAMGHSTAHLWVFESNVAAIRFYERLGAVKARHATKELYGQAVPSVRMQWSDLSTIGVSAGHARAPLTTRDSS